MKRYFNPAIVLFVVAVFIFSCDKVNDPYSTNSTGGGDTSVVKVRKVLIEDYTGHKCGNCPEAAITAQTIKAQHGEQVVVMAVHAGFFAKPLASPYNYDFRTQVGDDFDNFFVQGSPNPLGMINRSGYATNTHIKPLGIWASIVDTVITKAPDAWIEIENTYNSSTRKIDGKVKTEFLNMMTGTYKLIILLTEDSIVKPQLDYSQPAGQQNVLNYVHHHVLRTAISSTSWGDVIATGSAAAGDSAEVPFSYTLPATFPAINGIAPNEDKCYIVAFIYDSATYEVIQVEEKKIR